MGASRPADRQIHQIWHPRGNGRVDECDLITDLTVSGAVTHEGPVGAAEGGPQRGGVIEVDTYDLELGITECGAGRLGVAGQDPHLLAVVHKRLGQSLTDQSGTAGQSNHVEPSFARSATSDATVV